MEELDLLKKDWKKKEKDLPRLSYDDIYNMILKKSSSIVKWIFYISIFELLIGVILSVVFVDDQYVQYTKELHVSTLTRVFEICSFGVLIYFMIKFYKSYKKISVTDDAKTLMQNILDTRRTVKRYIQVALSLSAVYLILYFGTILFTDTEVRTKILELASNNSPALVWTITICAVLLFTALFITLFWLLYQLFYGILLKRLRTNYRELKKMDL